MNEETNEECGGHGDLGCKGGREERAQIGIEWTCLGCGFENREWNERCGGTGPLGCNKQKYDDASRNEEYAKKQNTEEGTLNTSNERRKTRGPMPRLRYHTGLHETR